MKIVIADDHPLITTGFIKIIAKNFPYAICEEAQNYTELTEVIRRFKPDILFQDIRFGSDDAREFLNELSLQFPDVKIIIISSLDDDDTIKNLMSRGMHGYLLKSDPEEEIIMAINEVMNGNNYISHEIKKTHSERSLLFQNTASFSLTPREKDILKLIGNEFSTKEIAAELFLSEKTIENYRSGLFIKFDVKNVAGLVKKAFLQGHL